VLSLLAGYHDKHEDCPMGIAYHRSVIEECNLPPNSIDIVEIYLSIDLAFVKLKDN
jgi:hypothetical protein